MSDGTSLGHGALSPPVQVEAPSSMVIGGIRSTRTTRAALAQQMADDVSAARAGLLAQPRIVIASNGQVIARYHSDRDYRAAIDRADIIDVDGMPLVMATRLLCRTPLPERIATTDFVRDASDVAAEKGIRFYFLGALPGRAALASENLERAYPKLDIVGTRHGYFEPDDEAAICAAIVAAGTDVLWLGLGTPRQEAFAFRNRERLSGVAWIRTCGGLFDFYAEHAPRAPEWMQRLGLEWLFRSFHEPRRLGLRYLATNPSAFYHLFTKTHD